MKPRAQPPEERLKALLGASNDAPLCVAESCTGGLICARITSVPGSSAYFDRGFVVYSEAAKTELLGVEEKLLEEFGAVSKETARALLDGIFSRTSAGIAAAVTGIAGPDGGSPEKPVGTVWIAWGLKGACEVERLNLKGSRDEIRCKAADIVLEKLCLAARGI